MVKEIIDFIKNFLGDKYYSDDIKLDSRVEFRLNKNEKILLETYCNFRGITKSSLIRSLIKREIDYFIACQDLKEIPYLK